MAIIQNLEAFVQSYPAGLDSVTDLQLSQNENGRQIRFTIGGVTIPAGSVATISGTKPDGVVYSNTGTIEGDDTVIFDEDVQMTAVFGTWYAKIRITNAGNTIASARVRFIIDKDPVDAGAIPSESQLDGLVAEAEEYAEVAEDAAERAAINYGSPLTASTASAMTDINRVYVYTGSESGYTYGNWYYYNGSAWVSGGIYNSAAVETDTTLTESGVPADAKATGDKIAELKDDIKLNKPLAILGEIGTIESGMTGLDGTVVSADTHISVDVSEGDIYYITGWSYGANYPLYTVYDSNNNIIANGQTGGDYIVKALAIMPEGASNLYVRGRRDGSGLEPHIFETYTPYVIESSGDLTDRTAEIREVLTKYGYAKLGTGQFRVKMLDIPQNATIEGSGRDTVLSYHSSETTASVIRLQTNMESSSPSIVTISNMTLDGGLSTRPSAYGGKSTRIGIQHTARNTLLKLNNVNIIGFSGDGVLIKNVGLEECYSIQMINCLIKYCGIGINFDAKAEYANITNVLFHSNFIGCNNYGGNNKYTNCGFENNNRGFLLDRNVDYIDSSISYLNNGHSSACGCSFNHNSYPILGGNYYNGFAFVGCMIFAGTIIISGQVKGLLFANCMIGANTAIQIIANYLTRFTNCIFLNIPTNISLPATHNLIMFNECYELESGTAVTY